MCNSLSIENKRFFDIISKALIIYLIFIMNEYKSTSISHNFSLNSCINNLFSRAFKFKY